MSDTILTGTIHVLTDKENQVYTPMYPTSRKDLIEGLENVNNIANGIIGNIYRLHRGCSSEINERRKIVDSVRLWKFCVFDGHYDCTVSYRFWDVRRSRWNGLWLLRFHRECHHCSY